jgi:iron complex outermembrane recepter protein
MTRRTLPSPHFRCTPLHAAVAALLSLGTAGAAQAQTPAPAPQGGASLERVTITSSVRKKVEQTQDIPATVNVLLGSELAEQGVNDVKGIEYRIPGLVLGNLGFDGALLGIRGASSTRGFTGDEATVAVHLDGIYVPQSGAALGRLFDVARVDTLYGPQGTLYGRNAVSGVIDIVSNAPTKRFGASAQASVGNFGGRAFEGYVNVPLSERTGLRVAASAATDDGFVANVLSTGPRQVGNDEFGAGRVRLVHEFNAGTKLDVTLQVSKDNSIPPIQPRYLDRASARTTGVFNRQTAIDQDVNVERKDSNLAIKFDIELGPVLLRSITGYTTYESTQALDRELSISPSPAGRIDLFQDSKAFSQELIVSALDPGMVDWRVGAYYTSSKVNENRRGESLTSVFPGQRDYDDFRLKQDGAATALFASIDVKPISTLTLSAGVRGNQESKKQTQDHIYGNAAPPAGAVPLCAGLNGAPVCRSVSTGDFDWSGTTGDLSAKWQLNRQSMVYGRVATGFRSGAVGGYIGQDNYFDQLFGGTGTFEVTRLKPEKLDSVEVGVKNTLMDGRAVINVALFQNQYKDQLYAFTDPVTFRFVDGNVGKSKLNGVDLTGAFVAGGLRVDGAVSYLDGKITAVDPGVTDVAVGNKPVLAPKLSASLGVSYRFPMLGGELSLGGEYTFKDEMFQDLQNTILRPSVELVNLNAAWKAPGGKWRLFASVNNALDKEYLERPANALGGAPTPVFAGAPRKIKLGAAINF